MESANISAFITNLGRYNEGFLVGEWLAFPTTHEAIESCFNRIGIDGIHYEEWFITDYNLEISGLYNLLGEYESLDELNYFTSLLEEHDCDIERLEAALEFGENVHSLKDAINLLFNLDNYEFYPDISNEGELGLHYADAISIPEHIEPYFDYEQYGRDICMEENGGFIEGGYIRCDCGDFNEEYDGMNVPDEYRLFAHAQRD